MGSESAGGRQRAGLKPPGRFGPIHMGGTMTMILPWHPDRVRETLDRIVPLLRNGAVMVYPTETVYGLGGVASRDVVDRIYRIKRRPPEHGLIFLMPSIRHVLLWSEAVQHARILRLARAFWPGPLTLVLVASRQADPEILRSDGTLAVRISSHFFCQAVVQRLQRPVITTSANLHGMPPARTVQEAVHALEGVDFGIDGGVLSAGRPSTILHIADDPPRILRRGPVSRRMIERVLHAPVETVS